MANIRGYGISSWIVTHSTAGEAAEQLAAAGFKEVELSADACMLMQAWEKEPSKICARLSAAGIGVPSVHSAGSGRRLDVEDEEARKDSIQANIEYFARMKDCGVPEIVIHATSSADVSTPQKRAESKMRSVESLKALAERAADYGVRMAVENIGRMERPGSSMAELLEMIDGLGDHVGLCFDIGHAEQAGLDLVNELRTAARAGKLFSLHIHDVKPEGKDHFIPGEGRIDFDLFIRELNIAGFVGGRMLEISPPEADVTERLRQAAEVREAWERMRVP